MERERVTKDNKMYPFCLLHNVEDVWYAEMTDMKPVCTRPKCKGEHIQWLHEILRTGCASISVKDGTKGVYSAHHINFFYIMYFGYLLQPPHPYAS
jgi:hypothetical protein